MMKNISGWLIIIAALWMSSAYSASVYKCTKKDGSVIFTDKECANMPMSVVHKETDQQVQQRLFFNKISYLKQLVSGGQLQAAQDYASKNNLLTLYEAESENYKLAIARKAQEDKQAAVEQAAQQQLAIQKQQLELQKQQAAAEKAKLEQQPTVVYPVYRNHTHNVSSCWDGSDNCANAYTSPSTSTVTPTPVNATPVVSMPMNPPNRPVR
jgi:biotin carboxyl carrier protein